MVRCNPENFASIGFSRQPTLQFATIADSGFGSSFVEKNVLHEYLWKNIHPNRNLFKIRDANDRSVNVHGTIELIFNIRKILETVIFNVDERRATQVSRDVTTVTNASNQIVLDNE